MTSRKGVIACLLLGAGCLAACGASPKPEAMASSCELRRGDCTPEEAQSLLPSQLDRSAALRLKCGIAATADDVSQHRCRQRVEQLLAQWHTRDQAFIAPASQAIRVTTAATCADTSGAGRAAAECSFYDVRAEVDLDRR